MSHENIRKITIKNDKVFLTSVASNVEPQVFATWECAPLSKVLAENGRDALLATIGEEIWNGNMRLQKGTKLCTLFLNVRNQLPRDLNFSNYDSKTAGAYLGKMVSKLEREPSADISGEVEEMLALRNNREYIIESTRREGWNYLEGSDAALQQDRDFALEVVKAGEGRAWFRYPTHFKKDKEFALEALKLNGCFYRELDEMLQEDRDIIFWAFREIPGRQFYEHLPDLIPLSVYCDTSEGKLSIDRDFVFALLEICPPIHLARNPLLVNDREIALKWCKTGRFFPHSVTDLPDQFVQDKEFQDTLCERFAGSDDYEYLVQNLALKGVFLQDPSIDLRIQEAKARQSKQTSHHPHTKSELEKEYGQRE